MQERYIYVSYSLKDSEKVLEMIRKLKEMGFRVLYDNGLEAGLQWTESVAKMLLDSHCMVVFLTENALKSHAVMQEMNFAMAQGKKVIPVYLEEIQLNPGMCMQLSNMEAVFKSRHPEDFLEQLCKIPEVSTCREEEEKPFEHTLELPLTSASEACDEKKVQSWFCPTCGQQQDGSARFCKYCGSMRSSAPSFAPSFPGASREICVKEEKMPPPSASMAPSMTAPITRGGEKYAAPSASVPKKKSLGERIRDRLLGNKTSDVSFSVLTPATFPKGLYTMVDVYAYEEAFRHVVEKAKAERSGQEGTMKESDGGHLKVRKGARITVRLTSPDVQITDNEESRVWEGKYTKFDFPVMVPQDYKKSQILFCAHVYFDDVIATNIRFVADCYSTAPQRPALEQNDVHSAFISYASGDRERVSLILQGMRRSRPDLDIFFDVETLKTGETWESILRKEIDRRDVLYLCWSPLARESKWVDMEWRYALKQKGPDGIEPIPLVLPKDCPPPKELEGKHFGARELFYR